MSVCGLLVCLINELLSNQRRALLRIAQEGFLHRTMEVTLTFDPICGISARGEIESILWVRLPCYWPIPVSSFSSSLQWNRCSSPSLSLFPVNYQAEGEYGESERMCRSMLLPFSVCEQSSQCVCDSISCLPGVAVANACLSLCVLVCECVMWVIF